MQRSTRVALLTIAGLIAAVLLVAGGFLLGANPDIGGTIQGLFPGTSSGGSSGGDFALYNDDWSPKPLIAVVDEQWENWLKEVHRRNSGETAE